MMIQKIDLSAVSIQWIVAIFTVTTLLFALMPGAQATPDPGIVISDQIIGTTPETFFVIRTTTLRPPSYYEYKKRIELVELSIPSGKIEQQCLVRETEYQYDFEASHETWTQAELVESGCQVFDILKERGANYIEPEGKQPRYYEFRLTTDGVSLRKADLDDPRPWQLMLTLADIKARATEMTKFSRSILSWRTQDDLKDIFSLVDPAGDFVALPELCGLNAPPVSALRQEWMFQKFICWSGDDDSYGAIFYLPIKHPRADE